MMSKNCSVSAWGRTLGCAAVFAFGLVSCASADYVTLTSIDTGGTTSFTDGTRWSDGLAPSADKDYLVAVPNVNNTQIRTPDSFDATKTFTFGGRSLTIGTRTGVVGDANVAGYYLSKTINGTVVTPDLRLVNGVYWMGTDGKHYHNGTITVLSPEANPFLIEPDKSYKRILYFGAAFKGAAGTGLKIGNGPCYLNGDNSEYLGQFLICNGATVTIADVKALGGTRADYDADAIRLDGGRLAYRVYAIQELGAKQNIGVFVTSKGGEIGIEGWSLDFTADVTGSGALTRRDNTSSSLKCSGTWSNGGLIHASPGYLNMANSNVAFVADCSIVMSNGFLCANGVASYTFTNRVVFAGGGVSGTCNVNADGTIAHSMLRFDGPLEIQQPIRLALYDFPSGVYTHETLFPIVEIPSSVCVVTASDFTPAFDRGAMNWCSLPRNPEVVVTTAEDGLQTVCLRFDPVVYNSTSTNPSYFKTSGHWSDGQAAHAGADYVVRNYEVRETSNEKVSVSYAFPGDSLSIRSDMTAHGYVIKQTTATFPEIRVYNYSSISIGGRTGTTGETQTLKADRIVVNTTLTGYQGFSFQGSMNRLAVIDAPFVGGVCIEYTGCRYRPIADNSEYTGAVMLDNASLEFSDEMNIGGNPASFNSSAIQMKAGTVLRPLASCTLDDSNRGLSSSNGIVEVAADLELTTKLRMVMPGGASIKKTGAGAWLLGGSVTGTSPAGTVSIQEGTLRPIAADAVQNAHLSFADGAKFAIGSEIETLGLVAVKTFTIAGTTLPVTVALPAEMPAVYTQPLFTVAAGNADDVAAKLAVAKPKGYRVEILKTATTVDSVSATTLTAKFVKEGCVFVIR